MRAIIVGCGRVGSTLAYQMSTAGHQVTVIDRDKSAFNNLPMDFRGRTLEGDVLTQNMWHRAEVEGADALAAVTTSDSLNIVVAHIAKTEYQVSKVIARNYDPRQRALQEVFGYPIVGTATLGMRRMLRLLSDTPLRPIHIDKQTNFVVYQMEVPKTWDQHPLEELLPPNEVKVLALIRDGQPIQLSEGQTMENCDLVYLSSNQDGIEALRRRLDIDQEDLFL